MLVGGDPGIGKSTLLLQVAARLASEGRKVIYVSGEESAEQVRLRAVRLGLGRGAGAARGGDFGARHPDYGRRQASRRRCSSSIPSRPCIRDLIEGAPGTVSQVRASAQELVRFAKEHGTAVVLVGHVTKDGTIAGPARARAYGRHGAELRRRAQPPVPHPARDEEPLRRDRRDRRLRDGRAGADRGAEPVGAVPDPSRRAGQRHERIPGDRGLAAGAGRDPGADRAAGDAAPRRGARRSAGTAGGWR